MACNPGRGAVSFGPTDLYRHRVIAKYPHADQAKNASYIAPSNRTRVQCLQLFSLSDPARSGHLARIRECCPGLSCRA